LISRVSSRLILTLLSLIYGIVLDGIRRFVRELSRFRGDLQRLAAAVRKVREIL